MEVLSVYRGARISAFKARELTREIQGLAASAALDLIAFSPKKAALLVGKTLKSAIANAENNNELRVDTLVVKEATVGEGPTMKRSKSRARGSSSMIRKRTAHIRIVLSDEIELPQRRKLSKPVGRSVYLASRRDEETPSTNAWPGEITIDKGEDIVPIEPFARFNRNSVSSSAFEIGKDYLLTVGIHTNPARLLASTPPEHIINSTIQFDVLISCNRANVQIIPQKIQAIYIGVNRKMKSLIYRIVPTKTGIENIEVNFLYRGNWAAQLKLSMHVEEKHDEVTQLV